MLDEGRRIIRQSGVGMQKEKNVAPGHCCAGVHLPSPSPAADHRSAGTILFKMQKGCSPGMAVHHDKIQGEPVPHGYHMGDGVFYHRAFLPDRNDDGYGDW